MRVYGARSNLGTGDDEEGGWRAAGYLRVGDRLLRPDGKWTRILGIKRERKSETVYNFAVADNHNYVVGTYGTLVHNQYNVPVPNVANKKLANIVRDLYKGAKSPKPIGTGSTADAVRNELVTGLPTRGRFHSDKANQYINALSNWLRKNPGANSHDRMVAQSLLDDLSSALAGK